MAKTAFITGITGQDGYYLSRHLRSNLYKVYGFARPRSTPYEPMPWVDHIFDGDMLDFSSMCDALRSCRPDEIYNLAAQTFVPSSWWQPEVTSNVNGIGVLRLLDAVRKFVPHAKFYQASTSEMFGNATQSPQDETTPFLPASPYGVSKLYGHNIAVNYRQSYRMFIVCGICFNHESPRRPERFVSRKIAKAAAKGEKVILGHVDSKRDWGWAPDFVRGMTMAMAHDVPDDYVFATGEAHSVEEFAKEAYRYVGLPWHDYIEIDEALFRPMEVSRLQGSYAKAHRVLNWQPTVWFYDLVAKMVKSELDGDLSESQIAC